MRLIAAPWFRCLPARCSSGAESGGLKAREKSSIGATSILRNPPAALELEREPAVPDPSSPFLRYTGGMGLEIGGTTDQPDWPKLGPSLLIATCLIVAIRTAKWTAYADPRLQRQRTRAGDRVRSASGRPRPRPPHADQRGALSPTQRTLVQTGWGGPAAVVLLKTALSTAQYTTMVYCGVRSVRCQLMMKPLILSHRRAPQYAPQSVFHQMSTGHWKRSHDVKKCH